MSLTDEQITEIALGVSLPYSKHSFARTIESAATAPLLERIKELEADLYELGVREAKALKAARQRITALEQQLEAARKDAGWRPIETAPKDGTVIDLWHEEFGRMPGWYWGLPHHCCGEFGSLCDSDWHSLDPGWVDEFNESHGDAPDCTHWKPLPPPPIDAAI